jgi:hypothetical protein
MLQTNIMARGLSLTLATSETHTPRLAPSVLSPAEGVQEEAKYIRMFKISAADAS